MHQRGEVKIQDISNFEDKSFNRVELSSQDLRTHNKGHWSLDNFQKTGTISSQSTASEGTSGFQVIEVLIRIIFMPIPFFFQNMHWFRFTTPYRFGLLCRAVRGSAYMNSSLLGSSLLGRNEKHIKEFSHHDIVCNKISNRGPVLTRVYPREVQAQFRGKVNCITRSMHSILGFTTYEVVEQVANSTFNKFLVTYDAVSREVKCQCLLFESRGILCRHSLSALSFERVDNNIKRRHTHIKSSQDESLLEPRSKRFDELVFRSHIICEFVSEFEELTRIMHWVFDKVTVEMQEYQEKSKEKSSSDVERREQPSKKISNAMKKKKKTAASELNLLDDRSSIHSSSSLYNAPDMSYPREDYTSFSFY
ncbi:hypothetical protein Ahy_A10g047274 [Arachis hypogaea]|uniref:Protein FAR1-RELATED SEQUENCE n=1 Tax=Arachis hypogaea TaxID=3818 RepID=A0A445B234_ARAHY|nr:hypothetical protein Ahy_A10g047274 [Arachis hypogaea]